jgi:hypothetical protein
VRKPGISAKAWDQCESLARPQTYLRREQSVLRWITPGATLERGRASDTVDGAVYPSSLKSN